MGQNAPIARTRVRLSDADRAHILEERMAGKSFRQIAAEYGCPHTTVMRAYRKVVREYLTPSADEAKALELARLERLLVAWWPKALAGDAKAAELVLRIIAQRADYLGMRAPLKVDLTAYIYELAEREGLDPQEAVAIAERIIASR